jgi:hypothetical protein
LDAVLRNRAIGPPILVIIVDRPSIRIVCHSINIDKRETFIGRVANTAKASVLIFKVTISQTITTRRGPQLAIIMIMERSSVNFLKARSGSRNWTAFIPTSRHHAFARRARLGAAIITPPFSEEASPLQTIVTAVALSKCRFYIGMTRAIRLPDEVCRNSKSKCLANAVPKDALKTEPFHDILKVIPCIAFTPETSVELIHGNVTIIDTFMAKHSAQIRVFSVALVNISVAEKAFEKLTSS